MSNEATAIQTNALSQVEKLKETLNDLQPVSSKYMGIIFNASKLMIYNRQQHNLNKMIQDLNHIFSSSQNKCFILLNSDLLCIVEKSTQLAIERQISQFKRTIPMDPLISDVHKRELFVTTFDLGTKWRDFCIHLSEIQENPLYSTKLSSSVKQEIAPLITDGIKTETLSLIEGLLRQSDISNFIRRQNVYWFDGNSSYKPLSQHLYISLMEIQNSLNISEPLTANAWLFKQITFHLDRQMLKNLPNLLSQKSTSSTSINLNLRTLVTPYFNEFIKKCPQTIDLTVYFDIVDLIAHPDVILYAEEILKPRNIKTGFNNIQSNHLNYLNLIKVPCDVFKINASSNLLKMKDTLKELLTTRGENSIILHRCDTEEQVKNGISAGIQIFEGKYLDTLNKPKLAGR